MRLWPFLSFVVLPFKNSMPLHSLTYNIWRPRSPAPAPREQEEKKKRKRGPADDGWDSEDSDFEDLKGFERSGLSLALRGAQSVALAPSIAASLGGRSLAAKSAGGASRGGRTVGGRSQASHGERSQKPQKGSQHSGDRFKAKRKGTGGWVGAWLARIFQL